MAVAEVVEAEAVMRRDTSALPAETAALLRATERWLHWGDSQLLRILVASVVSIDMSGDPIWVLLLKPSGGGGTEILRAFQGESVVHLSTITPRTLISGLRPDSPSAKTGEIDLMKTLDGKVVCLKDFTSVLSLDNDDLRRVLGDLREAYDGSLVKAYGSVGRKEAKAHFGLIATAVTQAAEQHRRAMAPLGERFIWLRFKPDAQEAVSQAYDTTECEPTMRQELAEAMGACCDAARGRLAGVRRVDGQRGRLIAAACLTANLRTPVARSHTGQLQVETEAEIGARLVKVFRKLALAHAAVRGVTEPGDEEMKAVIRVVHDTIPPFRRQIVSAIHGSPDITYEDLADRLSKSKSAIRREVEELAILRAVRITRGPFTKRVSVTERIAAWWEETGIE